MLEKFNIKELDKKRTEERREHRYNSMQNDSSKIYLTTQYRQMKDKEFIMPNSKSLTEI